MPTLGEKLKEWSAQGIEASQREKYMKHAGADPASFDPSLDYDQFKAAAFQSMELRKAAAGAMLAPGKMSDKDKWLVKEGQRKAAAKQENADLRKQRRANPFSAMEADIPVDRGAVLAGNYARSQGEDPSVGPFAGAIGTAGSAAVGAAKGTYQALKEDPWLPSRLALRAVGVQPQYTEAALPSPETNVVSTYNKEVIDPRMAMPPATRTWQAVKDTGAGMWGLAKSASGLEGAKRVAETGEALGHGLTYGGAGAIGTFMENPSRAIMAQPEIIAELLPLARGGGAALRSSKTAAGAGRTGKAARFTADVLDPQKPIRSLERNRVEVNEMAREVYDRWEEWQERESRGEVAEGAADNYLAGQQTLIRARMKTLSVDESTGSKVGRAVRRAGIGATLLGEAAGGNPWSFGAAAAASAGIPVAAGAAAKRIGSASDRAKIRQLMIDSSAMATPDMESHVREVSENPQRIGSGLLASGRGMMRKVGEDSSAVGMSEVAKPIRWSERDLNLDPDSGTLQAPPQTVGPHLSLDKMRREELSVAESSKQMAVALRRQAFEISEDMRADVGKDAPHFYSLSRKYVEGRDRAHALRKEAGELSNEVNDAIKQDPGAYETMRLNVDAMNAREAYKEAKVRASILDQTKVAHRPEVTAALKRASEETDKSRIKMSQLEVSEPSAKEAIVLERQVAQSRRVLEATELLESTGKVKEHWAGGKTAQDAADFSVTPRKYLQMILESDVEQLEKMKSKIKDYDAYMEARDAVAAADNTFAEMKKKFGKVVERASKTADELYNAEIDLRIKKAQKVEHDALLAGLSDARRKEIKSAGKEMGRTQEHIDTMLLEAARVEAANIGRRQTLIKDKRGETVVDLLSKSDVEQRRSKAAEKVAGEYPDTESRLDKRTLRSMGMGNIERSLKPEKAGDPVKAQALVVRDPESIKTINEIARIVREADPASPIGDPNYLSQVIANVWSDRILTGAFSKRVRGKVAVTVANEVLSAFPDAPWQKLTSSETGLSQTQRLATWLDVNPKSKIFKDRKKVERIIRQRVEKLISDEMSKAIITGNPTNIRLSIPTKNGTKIFSGAEISAKMLKELDLKSPKEAAAIRTEAISGVLETIKSHVVSDETHSAMGREAMRSMSLGVDTPVQTGHALAAHRVFNSNEARPNIILFDPKKVSEELSNPEAAKAWYADGMLPNESVPDNPVSAFKKAQAYFTENFVEADDTVGTGIKAGIRKQGGSISDATPIYVQKGYNESVGTHLRHIKAADEMRGLIADMGGFAKVQYLVGTIGTQVANAFSNVMAISVATGRSPVAVSVDVAAAFKQMNDWEQGRLTGYEAARMKHITSTGIIDSSMLSDRFALMGALDTSRGAKSKFDAYMQLRKEIYKQGDSGPKLMLSLKAYDDMYKMLDNIEPGRTAQVPTGKGNYITFRKNAKGEISINDGKTFHPRDSDAVLGALGRSSVRFAGDILFNFNDLPGFVKKAIGTKNVMLTPFNPYMSWSHKASELPGKPGIMSNALGYDPTHGVITDSPILQRERAMEFGKMTMRRFATAQSLKGVASIYKDHGIGQQRAWNTTTAMSLADPMTEDLRTADMVDLTSGSFAVMADSALRFLQTGAVYFSQIFHSPEDYREMAQSDNEYERNAAKMYYMHKSGDLVTLKTLASYFGITGTMLHAQLRAIDEGTGIQQALKSTMRMITGGDITILTEAAAEIALPETRMTSRKYLKTMERKEVFSKWFISSMFRFGMREIELEGAKGIKAGIARRKRYVTEHHINPLKKDLEIANANDNIEEVERIEGDIEVLKQSLLEVVEMYTQSAEEAIQSYNDAQ